MRKIIGVLLALAMVLSLFTTVFAVPVVRKNDELSDYSIIFYSDGKNRSSIDAKPIIFVLSEEQLLQLGSSVKNLFDDASMLYVLTEMSISEICEACAMPSLLRSDETPESKFATAITKDTSGHFVFNDVSALYVDPQACRRNNKTPYISETQKVYDGLSSVLKTTESKLTIKNGSGTKMQAPSFDAYSSDSAVIYDSSGNRIGTMGYTTYWYKIVKSGSNRIFDVIAVATFAPDPGYKCASMSVYLGTSKPNHEVLEAANIVSNGQTTTLSLSLSAGKLGVTGGDTTSWTYDVNAQTVTKSFDMTTNDRTWTFKPKKAGNGDAWIEEPGIRMHSTQKRCYTTVSLSCPFVTLFGVELSENTLSKTWYTDY